MEALRNYAWPGNVRQLENVVERAVLLSRNEILSRDDLPPEVIGKPAANATSVSSSAVGFDLGETGGMSLREALEVPERQIILQSLRQHKWNRAATADALDINRTTLYKKMKRLGLDDPRLQFA